jgi:hypothetical protein
MPNFISFITKESIYEINPTNPSTEIGVFNVIGKISDS